MERQASTPSPGFISLVPEAVRGHRPEAGPELEPPLPLPRTCSLEKLGAEGQLGIELPYANLLRLMSLLHCIIFKKIAGVVFSS